MRGWLISIVTFVTLAVVAASCGTEPERLDPFEDERDAGSEDATIVIDSGNGPPSLDSVGYCGNQLIETRDEPKNLYFIVDRSGSMGTTLDGTFLNRFDAVREAIAAVLADVGHRLSYGAAVFPGIPARTTCAVGTETFSARPGDPAIYSATGTFGPVLTDFLSGLASIVPTGGTPLSPTLVDLVPSLEGLPGETFVVLATDGHPNCNADAQCSSEDCTPSQNGAVLRDGTRCSLAVNCCTEDRTAQGGGPLGCVDGDASVTAIGELFARGVKTYVIGLPDSEQFAPLLDEMATAGGTARPEADQAYYPVVDAEELSSQLQRISADVVVDCDIELDEEPPDPDLVNVYFDIEVLPQNADDGWVFTSDSSIRIRGPACERLLRGDVLNVQIVAGCPTEIR